MAGTSGPMIAWAGAYMCPASPKANANRPTETGSESQVRARTSVRETTRVDSSAASPVGSANRQNPCGNPRGKRGRSTARRYEAEIGMRQSSTVTLIMMRRTAQTTSACATTSTAPRTASWVSTLLTRTDLGAGGRLVLDAEAGRGPVQGGRQQHAEDDRDELEPRPHVRDDDDHDHGEDRGGHEQPEALDLRQQVRDLGPATRGVGLGAELDQRGVDPEHDDAGGDLHDDREEREPPVVDDAEHAGHDEVDEERDGSETTVLTIVQVTPRTARSCSSRRPRPSGVSGSGDPFGGSGSSPSARPSPPVTPAYSHAVGSDLVQ